MQSGSDSFVNLRHFIGVVEDRNDPLQLGRVRVRVYSIHTEDKSLIKTKDLPWALVLQPGSNPATSGIGQSGTGIVEGTWVFGLFLDQGEYQNPLILGAMHGMPVLGSNPTEGFNDPRGVYPKDDPEIHSLGETSISRLARGRKHAEQHTVMVSKREGKDKLGKVDTAKAPAMGSVISRGVFSIYNRRKTWVEPHPRTGDIELTDWFNSDKNYSTYPYCHVWYTESGHALEVDDTPGAERLHMYHKSGTFQEIQADGDKIEKIIGDNYEIDLKNKHLYVSGDYTVTVDGDMKELVHGDKYTEVDGNHFVTVRKDYVKKVQGNELKEILSDKSTQVNGNENKRTSGNFISAIVGAATESIKGTFTKTTAGEEKRTNLSSATHILADNYTLLGANNLNIAAGGNLNIAAQKDIIFKAVANMDIDANTMTIDAATMSIDGPAGNITSNEVTLHTHTHQTTSMDTGDGANSGSKNASDSPNSDPSET